MLEFVREHDLAQSHPLATAAVKKADHAIAAARKTMLRKAKALRAKAEAMLDQASNLEYDAQKDREYGTPFAVLREKIEDAGYWAARNEIGTLPRKADGNYLAPPPKWAVSYNGESLGVFEGEERCDVLGIVCPPKDDRNWGDFEVERVAA